MLISMFVGWLRRPMPSSLDVVDDPDGAIRLVRLRGHVSAATLIELLEAGTALRAPRHVHLDLIDARIPTVTAMHALERTVDHVERLGVAVRVVGLDPHHPALSR